MLKKSVKTVQKKEKPKIEIVASVVLEKKCFADLLTIVDFIKSKDIVIRWDYRNTWVMSFKRKRVCYIKITKNSWCLLFFGNYAEGYKHFLTSEKLKDMVWENVCHCHCCVQCNPLGMNATIAGKEFNQVCQNCNLRFENATGEYLDCIKLIILWRLNQITEKKAVNEEHINMKNRKEMRE